MKQLDIFETTEEKKKVLGTLALPILHNTPKEVIQHREKYKVMQALKKYCDEIGETRINFKEDYGDYSYRTFHKEYDLKPLYDISCVYSNIIESNQYSIYINYHINDNICTCSISDRLLERANWEREKNCFSKISTWVVYRGEFNSIEGLYRLIYANCLWLLG